MTTFGEARHPLRRRQTTNFGSGADTALLSQQMARIRGLVPNTGLSEIAPIGTASYG
jgi:hypothetical protein